MLNLICSSISSKTNIFSIYTTKERKSLKTAVNSLRMDLKYFNRNEFKCPCCGLENMSAGFLQRLDIARGISGIAFKINSGTRCVERNLKVGGSTNSAHLEGYAADIKCEDSRSRALIISGLAEAGFNRIGIAKNFIHVDNHPQKDECVIWLY